MKEGEEEDNIQAKLQFLFITFEGKPMFDPRCNEYPWMNIALQYSTIVIEMLTTDELSQVTPLLPLSS